MAKSSPDVDPSVDAGISLDAILDGRLSLRQPRKGHRAGTDAVLLAAAAPAGFGGFAIDVGAGVGTAGLILAMRCPASHLALVENDMAVAALAGQNLALNGLEARAKVHDADIFSKASQRGAGLMPGMADLVMTNPPYADPDRARVSLLAGKRKAHAMPAAGEDGGPPALTRWVRACIAFLAPGGVFLMIHRPDALPDILAACGGRVGGICVLPIHPQKNKNANRILLRGKKGSRAPFALAPPLILQEGGRFTAEAEAIHRGEALIGWGDQA